MKNNKKRGFTLVELLVVIAILAILATVSVVGYTSFIESANVAVDEDLVAQLNNFLAAYKVNNTEDITEDNAWEVTQEILELAGLDKINGLVPKSKDNHFYFNVDEQEYQLVTDNLIGGSGSGSHFFNFLANAAGADKPGVFYKNGEKLFLVDTTGTVLADVVRGFYTFDNIQGEDKFAEFQKKVDGIALEYPIISEWAKHSVFITADGIEYVTDSALTNYVFHSGRINIDNETPNVTLSDRVVVPGNIEYIGTGAFNITYNEGGKLVFTKPANEFAQYVSEDFINVPFEINGQDWHIADGTDSYVDMSVITPVSDSDNTQYPIGATNPMQSFDIVVNGATDKLHNNYNNLPNNSVVVWDGKTFTLAVTNKTATDNTKPVSSNRVTYTLNGEPAGVSVAPNGTITLSAVNGVFPETASFTVTANAVYGDATQTITVLLARPTAASITVDGETVGNANKLELIYGQLSSGSNKNEYTVGASTSNPVNHIDTFKYATDNVVVTVKSGTMTVDGKKLTASDATFPNDVTNTDVVINVKIGEYFSRDITLNMLNLACYFEATGVNTVGTEGSSVSFEHLFKLMDGVTLPAGFTASVGVYPEPTGDATLADLKTLGSKLGTSNKLAVYTDADTPNTVEYGSNGAFNLSLAGNSAKVVFVVTITNGTEVYRASENLVVDVVSGYNVKDYSELQASENNVLLSDIEMTQGSRFVFTGKTFYGNCYEFNIEKGVTSGYWGIIELNSATLKDTKVVGALYGGVGIAAPDPWGSNAIHAKGTTTISNCYIANCRAPITVGNEDDAPSAHNVTISDSVLFGGRYANVELRSGTLTFDGKVITVNQPHTNSATVNGSTELEVGLGVMVWLEAPSGCKIDGEENLIQYNFIPSNFNDLPVVSTTQSGLTVNIETSDVFDKSFNNPNAGHKFGSGDVKYLNSGIIGEDIGEGLSKIVNRVVSKNLPYNDRTGFAGSAPTTNHAYVKVKITPTISANNTSLQTALNLALRLLSSLGTDAIMHVYTMNDTEANQAIFEASRDAEFVYSPWAHSVTVGSGDTAVTTNYTAYDFVDGKIIPQN